MPAESAEQTLISKILNDTYPKNCHLPPERELAGTLGVTRPTLREVLQRLARDGWLDIQHGKPTRVRDYSIEGGLSLLGHVAANPDARKDLRKQIFQLRALIAPVYTRMAVELHPEESTTSLTTFHSSLETAQGHAEADWNVHYQSAILSGNVVFTLIWKNLEDCYKKVLTDFYENPENRQKAGTAYRMVSKAARVGEPDAAEAIMKRYSQETL